MSLKIANVTVNTARPRELADWWANALGERVTTDWGEYVMVGGAIAFQYVEDTSPGRIHVDLVATDHTAEVERLIASGAERLADHQIPGGGFSWTVLADPDGNEFCVSGGHSD